MDGDDRWLSAQTGDLYIAADYLMTLLLLMNFDLEGLGHMGPERRVLVEQLFILFSHMFLEFEEEEIELMEAFARGDMAAIEAMVLEIVFYMTENIDGFIAELEALIAEELTFLLWFWGIAVTDEELQAMVQEEVDEILEEFFNLSTEELFEYILEDILWFLNWFFSDASFRSTFNEYLVLNTPSVMWFYNLSTDNIDFNEAPRLGFFDEDNIETRIIEPGEIAYLRINSFINEVAFDLEMLLPFYNEIQDFEHLIIDIRGNGGGWISSFPFNVLEMLLSEPVSFQYAEFFIASELTEDLFEDPINMALGTLYDIVPIAEFLRNTPMPLFNQNDAALLDYAIIWQVDFVPSRNAIPFGGEIWLLVDGNSASASELAAIISINTGFATVVGEPTAGVTGVKYTSVALPNTGILFRIDLGYTVDQFGRSIEEFGVIPQIPNMPEMDALETVLTLINPTMIDLDTAISINGETAASGVVIDGRTMVSVADVAYMFNTELTFYGWHATLTYGHWRDLIVVFTLGEDTALVRNNLVEMHIPTQFINGELFIPIRFIAETFGYNVGFYDGVVTITSN